MDKALMLRVRVAIEKAERRRITESVIANARAAVDELIDVHGAMPAMVEFIKDCWHIIEEFLASRSVDSVLVPIGGIEERALSAAWSALEELEIGVLRRGSS